MIFEAFFSRWYIFFSNFEDAAFANQVTFKIKKALKLRFSEYINLNLDYIQNFPTILVT